MRVGILAVIVLSVIVLAAASSYSAALADPTLVKVEPPQDAVLREAPGQVDMWFSEPLAQGSNATWVTLHRQGSASEIRPLYKAVHPSDPTHFLFSPPPNLTAGRYIASWKVTSAGDGAISEGEYAFTIDPQAAASPMPEEGGGPDALAIALFSMAGVLGGAFLAFLAYLFRRAIGWGWHRPPPGGLGGEHH